MVLWRGVVWTHAVVYRRAGFILAPGSRVESTNVGATWENRNDYCTSNGLTRCLGCTGADCEPASNRYGYTVWYNLPTAAAGDYTVTVTDGTATGAAVNVYRNQDGTMNSLIPVRGVGWGLVCVACVAWGLVCVGAGWRGLWWVWLCVTHCVLLCAVCCVQYRLERAPVWPSQVLPERRGTRSRWTA